MSETKFTKGEWVSCIRSCYLNQGYVSVEADGKRIYGESMYNTSEVEDTANAHLIASAPEMYSILELDLADLVYELKYCEPIYEHQIEKLKAKINQKTKLLAKARGESC